MNDSGFTSFCHLNRSSSFLNKYSIVSTELCVTVLLVTALLEYLDCIFQGVWSFVPPFHPATNKRQADRQTKKWGSGI